MSKIEIISREHLTFSSINIKDLLKIMYTGYGRNTFHILNYHLWDAIELGQGVMVPPSS